MSKLKDEWSFFTELPDDARAALGVAIILIVIILLSLFFSLLQPHWHKQGFDNEKQYGAFKEGGFEDKATFLQANAEGIHTASDWEAIEEAVKAGRSAKSKYPTSVYKAACKKNWHACENNSDYVNEHASSMERVRCQSRAERQVKYGEIDWPWVYFERFVRGDSLHVDGSITYIETNAKYQNIFGAMVKTTTYCQVDIASGNVFRVWIEN